MGAFYGNLTLKGVDQQRIAEALHGRRSIVAPNAGDYVIAFDSVCDDQDIEAIQALTSKLSRKFDCAALAAVVHDDDVLGFFLYQNGDLTDWYNSSPSYFDFDSTKEPAGPAGGSAERLCAVFAAGVPREVEAILRKPVGEKGYVFETERHRDLVHALGLPGHAVGTALASFDRGECPEGLSMDQMVRAADPPPVETPQQRWDREFYNKLGPEDASRPCKHEGCNRGAIPNSAMCKRHHFKMIQRRDYPCND